MESNSRVKKLIKTLAQPSNLILFAVLLLALFLRLRGLYSRDIWYDEALDVLQASKSLSQIIHDVPTPLHYFIIHFALFFGKNTFILGLPAVIFGLGSVYFVYKIGVKISGAMFGLIASFLLAISPMNVEFSQQILHYSYLAFFSIVSLYLFIVLISDLANGRAKWPILFLLFAVNGLNVITHISAFIIIAMELIFICCYLALQKEFIKKNKYRLLLLGFVAIIVGYALLIPGQGYYLKLLSGGMSFGTSKPIELGYSLSKQLNSTILIFNNNFFKAMFSWFGWGSSTLYLFLSLLVLGIISLTKKKPILSLLMLFWISYPFLQLYFIRPIHWFEEKYFIFIIPAYLLFIAEGIVFASAIISKLISSGTPDPTLLNKKIKNAVILIICVSIGLLAINPLLTRTTYGLPVEKKSEDVYSWRKVYDYLHANTTANDRVFVRSNEGLFFDFYFPADQKNKYWYDEGHLFNLKVEDYVSFISKDCNNYFVSIPDIGDTYVAGVVDYKQVAKAGGFNIYKFNFKRQSVNKLAVGPDGNWEYYDDFRNGKYLADAERWKNIATGYLGNFNLPTTYGYFYLAPTDFEKENSLDYKFELPPNTDHVVLNPRFSLSPDADFEVIAISGGKKVGEYTKKTTETGLFSPEVEFSIPKDSHDLEISFSFKFDPSQKHSIAQSNLKSFWLHNVREKGVLNYESVPGGSNISQYDAQLEVLKSNRWLLATTENEQWIQASDGILFSLSGQQEKPLIFDFKKLERFSEAKLEVKTFTTSNSISVQTSTDNGKSWNLSGNIANSEIVTTEFPVQLTGKELLVKFICKNTGSTCQLRGLKLTLSKP